MKNSKILLGAAALAFVLLMAGASALYQSLNDKVATKKIAENTAAPAKENQQTDNKQPAPDFTVTDAEGNKVRLSDFRGKPVVVNFWASWCGPCKSEMPDFDALYREYKEQIHFLMVNLTDGSRETLDIASEFIKEAGYTFPVYYDTEGIAADAYQVYSIPTTYFIDQAGSVAAYASSAIDEKTLRRGINMIYTE